MYTEIAKAFYQEYKGTIMFFLGLAVGLFILYSSNSCSKDNAGEVKNKAVIESKYKDLKTAGDKIDKEVSALKKEKDTLKSKVVESDIKINSINSKYESKINIITNQSSDADFVFLSKWLSEADTLR